METFENSKYTAPAVRPYKKRQNKQRGKDGEEIWDGNQQRGVYRLIYYRMNDAACLLTVSTSTRVFHYIYSGRIEVKCCSSVTFRWTYSKLRTAAFSSLNPVPNSMQRA